MALVPIKTSTGTGYCDCLCGCYELCSLRDEETGKGFCYRCAEQHLERNRALMQKIPKPGPPARGFPSLPAGFKPPALQNKS
ncbi:MAG: hypothetical protein ACREN5_17075 [Gemmatimonadales bacterium]